MGGHSIGFQNPVNASGEGLEQINSTQAGNQQADNDQQGFGLQVTAQPGGKRRGKEPADDQSGDDRPVTEAAEHGEGRGAGDGQEEFRRIDRADGGARVLAGTDQRGGDHRPPAAAAHRIDKAAGQRQRRDMLGRIVTDLDGAKGLGQNIEAHDQQVGGNPGFERVAVELGDHISADHAADHARNHQPQEQGLVDVAHAPVRQSRKPGGEDFGQMHRGGGGGRRYADAEQEGSGGDAVGHAQRAVDDLRAEADGGSQPEDLAAQPLDDDGAVLGGEGHARRDRQQRQQDAEGMQQRLEEAPRMGDVGFQRRQPAVFVVDAQGVVKVETAYFHGRDSGTVE